MAGFFTNGVCFPTIEQATDTYYSNFSPFPVTSAGTGFIVVFSRQDDGTWAYTSKNLWGQYPTVTPLPIPIFSSCETHTDIETQFFNGMELGWGVASVIVIAFVLRRLRRGF